MLTGNIPVATNSSGSILIENVGGVFYSDIKGDYDYLIINGGTGSWGHTGKISRELYMNFGNNERTNC